MAIDEDLLAFVNNALARGIPRAQIQDALGKAGWTAEQAGSALGAFADVEFPIPVPRARPYLSARDGFMYLVLFGTLYAAAFYVGDLLFDFLNIWFPDPAETYARSELYLRSAMRWSVSGLIVTFPVFMYMSWLTARDVQRDPVRRASKVRRWLTYLTLFAAAMALIGDVMFLLYNVLSGEAGIRFVLKVLTVAVIAGTAFTYYLRDLRLDEKERQT